MSKVLLILLALMVSHSQAQAIRCQDVLLASGGKMAFYELDSDNDPVTYAKWHSLTQADLNPRNTFGKLDLLRHRGFEVALLVKDGRFTGGERLVTGFIFDVISTQVKTMKFSEYLNSLPPAERAAASQGKRWSSDSYVVIYETKLIISGTPPSYDSGVYKTYPGTTDAGWYKRPKSKDLIQINLDNVVLAKFFH